MKTRSTWKTRGTFDCATGRFSGTPFSIDVDVLEHVTEYAANNDCAVTIRSITRDGSGQSRLTITMDVAH